MKTTEGWLTQEPPNAGFEEHMKTAEDQIARDLALVGRMSRVRSTPLEATLRAVSRGAGATVTRELALVAAGRVFVSRVAWAAAGLASLTCVVAMVFLLSVPRAAGWIAHEGHRGFRIELLEARRLWLGLFVVAVALAAHVGASGIAGRVLERRVARASDPVGVARRLGRRVDRWALAASIAGIAAFVVWFGMLEVVVGRARLVGLFSQSHEIVVIRRVMLGSSRGALFAVVIGAAVVARCRDARWLRFTTWMVPAGIALGGVTCLIGARFDVGPLVATIVGAARPSGAMRIALAGMGTIAVFLATTGVVLRGRRRDEAALAVEPADPEPR